MGPSLARETGSGKNFEVQKKNSLSMGVIQWALKEKSERLGKGWSES